MGHLQSVFDSYLMMKDAFVASDSKEVSMYSQQVKSDLKDVDMGLLTGDVHMVWMKYLQKLNVLTDEISISNDIEKQRLSFAEFNNTFYNILKTFGLKNGTVYYQYCPMANGDQGAYWLDNIKEIKNPYFGEAMLSCGETRETIEF